MINTCFPVNKLDLSFYQIFPKSNGFRIAFSIIYVLFYVVYMIIQFFGLTGLVQITIQSIYFKFISLLAKDDIELALCIWELVSDFGMFYFFILIVVYFVLDFFNFIKSLFFNHDVYTEAAKFIYLETNQQQHLKIEFMLLIYIVISTIYLIILVILFFVALSQSQYFFANVAYFYESIIITVVFFVYPLLSLFESTKLENLYYNSEPICYIVLKETETEIDSNSNNRIQINDNNEPVRVYDKNEISKTNIWYGILFCIFKSSNILKIASLHGMFEKEENQIQPTFENNSTINNSLIEDFSSIQNNENKCYNCDCISKWYFSIVTCGFQFSYYIYLLVNEKNKSVMEIIGYIVLRILLLPKILAYNIFYFIFYREKIWRTFKESAQKFLFILFIIYYIFMTILALVYLTISIKFSTITNAAFIEDNSKWYKNGKNQTFLPESFCYIKPPMDNLYRTEDFAMFTTLPRLYSFTNEGKCYIKPSMRGLFNSTMKYIFGKDYEQDEIYIFCKKMSHYPFLIITSEKIFNSTLDYFSNDSNITILEKPFNITNTDYFENITNLSEESQKLLDEYQRCTIEFGTENCEQIWDNFTQFYWPNTYNDSFVNISGFERYQITIDSEFVFQPRFITSHGKLMTGTHYIVGGSFEDKWGISFLIEAKSRTYVPVILDSAILFYNFLRDTWKEVFIQLEYLNRMLVLTEKIIAPGVNALTELYSQFNFSHEAMFAVGHSVGGTLMKGVSYYSDIRGIAFESSDAENTVDKELNPKFNISKNSVNTVANVFSQKNKFSSFDDDSYLNGRFIRGFSRPTTYQTACLTSITCSETKKYVPFCKQTFSTKKDKSEKEFDKYLNEYLNQYGFN